MKTISEILFNPAWISLVRLRKAIGACIEAAQPIRGSKWLDVGCGTRPYEHFFPDGSYTGVDIEQSGRELFLKKPDFFYDGSTLPFPDNSYDGVLCTQVLEHTSTPDQLLSEISRVLKEGGILILSAPFFWEEHEEPYDFFRYTRFGLTALLEQHDFVIDTLVKSTGSIEMMGTLFSVYLSNNLTLPIPGWGRAVTLFLCQPLLVFSLLLQKIMPDRGRLYLDCIILARKKTSTKGRKSLKNAKKK